MAQVQYNFKINEELKEELEAIMKGSDIEGKSDFLESLLNAFKAQKAREVDIDIDLDKYESTAKATKEAISKTFKHLLTIIEANSSSNVQEALLLEEEKSAFKEEKERNLKELESIKSSHNERLVNLQKEHQEALEIEKKQVQMHLKKMNEDEKTIKDLQEQLFQSQKMNEELKSVFENASETREELNLLSKRFSNLKKEYTICQDMSKKEIEKIRETSAKKIEELQKEVIESSKKLMKVELENTSFSKEIEKLAKAKKILEEEISNTKTERDIMIGKIEFLEKQTKEGSENV